MNTRQLQGINLNTVSDNFVSFPRESTYLESNKNQIRGKFLLKFGGLVVCIALMLLAASLVCTHIFAAKPTTSNEKTSFVHAKNYPEPDELHKKLCHKKNECLAYFNYSGVEGTTCVECPDCDSIVFVPGEGLTCLRDKHGHHCSTIRFDENIPKCFDQCPDSIIYNERGQPRCFSVPKKGLPFMEEPFFPTPTGNVQSPVKSTGSVSTPASSRSATAPPAAVSTPTVPPYSTSGITFSLQVTGISPLIFNNQTVRKNVINTFAVEFSTSPASINITVKSANSRRSLISGSPSFSLLVTISNTSDLVTSKVKSCLSSPSAEFLLQSDLVASSPALAAVEVSEITGPAEPTSGVTPTTAASTPASDTQNSPPKSGGGSIHERSSLYKKCCGVTGVLSLAVTVYVMHSG